MRVEVTLLMSHTQQVVELRFERWDIGLLITVCRDSHIDCTYSKVF